MRLLSFGEILWDIIDGVEHLGGAPFNFAAHSARCGHESFILSRVGKDSRGIKAFNKCKEYGVNNSLIQFDQEHPTGTVEVVLDKGQPDYTIFESVAFDFITLDNLLTLDRDMFEVFYFGSLCQRNVTSALTLKSILKNFSFANIFYDVNLRKDGYNKEIVQQSVGACTILKLNIDEVPTIARLLFDTDKDLDSFCRHIQDRFPAITNIVITAADKGCYVYADNQIEYVQGRKVDVKDAVGAGDAFSAAFMHSLYRTRDAVSAAETANYLGGFVASQAGPIPEYTTEIKDRLGVSPRVSSNN